jgi:small subunit ribosomal protein S21
MKQLRARQQFTKPSVTMRQQEIRAAYKQKMKSSEQ